MFISFLCTPGTRVRVFRWFIYFLFFFAPRDTRHMRVCGVFFFFARQQPGLTSRHTLRTPDTCTTPTPHASDTRSRPPTRVLDPTHTFLTPTHVFRPHTRVLDTTHAFRPPTHVFRSPLAPQVPKRTYEQSYVRFFFCFIFLASETRVRAVVHAFLMLLFILFYFIPPETRVRSLVHVSHLIY